MSTQKFRPYFTSSELQEIISALKERPNPRRLTICRYLESFQIKIERGILSPAHILDPTQEEKLGFSDSPSSESTAQIIGEAAYQKQLTQPSKCSPKEIAAAMDWRYRNNLMSAEEEKEYERANGITGFFQASSK